MKRGHIYIQHGFWKAVKDLGVSVFGPNAWDLFCVLRTSILHAEIPIEIFGQDDLLSILWHESGGSCYMDEGMTDYIINQNEDSIENLCSVYLLDKNKTACEKYAQSKGTLCLNSQMLAEQSYLITGKKILFDFHERGGYNGLKTFFLHPCNSLLLIDPYILNERSYIKNHLRNLFDSILPESLDIQFQISIFSGIGKINDGQLGESFFNEVLNTLKDIRPNLIFSLTIYQIPIQGEGWHARYLLTNNLMIHATEGFDFWGLVHGEMKAKKAGKFEISCPWLEKNNDIREYSIWINKAAKEATMGNGYHHERWGSKENRLFDLIK